MGPLLSCASQCHPESFLDFFPDMIVGIQSFSEKPQPRAAVDRLLQFDSFDVHEMRRSFGPKDGGRDGDPMVEEVDERPGRVWF